MTGRQQLAAAILEALEVGDVRGAELIALDALDEPRPDPKLSCEGCGRSFEWPGLLEAHKHRCMALWDVAA